MIYYGNLKSKNKNKKNSFSDFRPLHISSNTSLAFQKEEIVYPPFFQYNVFDLVMRRCLVIGHFLDSVSHE